MNSDAYSLAAFAILNGARVIAYLPQMVLVCRDKSGATAISAMTWSLFAAANVATVIYALVHSGDWLMALIFSFNALACSTIVVLIVVKRMHNRHRMKAQNDHALIGGAGYASSPACR